MRGGVCGVGKVGKEDPEILYSLFERKARIISKWAFCRLRGADSERSAVGRRDGYSQEGLFATHPFTGDGARKARAMRVPRVTSEDACERT